MFRKSVLYGEIHDHACIGSGKFQSGIELLAATIIRTVNSRMFW